MCSCISTIVTGSRQRLAAPDDGLQQPDKAKLALAELSGRADRLLVLDNVEGAESVRPWLPRDPTTGCRTLMTELCGVKCPGLPALFGKVVLPDQLPPDGFHRFSGPQKMQQEQKGFNLAGCEFQAPQKCLRLIKVNAISFMP